MPVRRRVPSPWLCVVAAVWLVIACQVDESHEPHVQNDTGQVVRVFIEQAGQEFEQIHQIEPGSYGYLGNYSVGCTDAPLIVRTINGDEIARRIEPLCPDQTWTVGLPISPPPS
jgi:hypothetical protein